MPNAHEGYVSWEKAETIRKIVSSNVVVNVEHDATGHALKAGTEQIDQFKPQRASWRQNGAFSRRETVGCDIKSVPDTGRRPQAIFKAGSLRSTSRSSQSSWPLAIANIRARIMSRSCA
jgi:hypothetical protein